MADARNTVEGKFLSVLMAALLVVSTFSVSAWAADTAQEASDVTKTEEVNDKAAPAEEPAVTPEPEKKAEPEKPVTDPEPEKPVTEEPKATPEPEKPAAQLETPAPRPETEQPATTPEPEKAADVTLRLKLVDATLTRDGKAVATDAKELTVPAGEDLKFKAEAAEGFALGAKAVKLIDASGVECAITPQRCRRVRHRRREAGRRRHPRGDRRGRRS